MVTAVIILFHAVTATYELHNEHLSELSKCLSCIRHKWYEIGIALNISVATLEVIKCDHSLRTDECFIAMLNEWLTNGNPSPCWKVLAETLSPEVQVIEKEMNISKGLLFMV